MDASEENPQRVVDTNVTACPAGSTQERRSPPSTAAVVSKVLDDDNILIDILLLLGFPTTLVRAALVCKRWYHHASDREFLSLFRKRHPPRLLGFYLAEQQSFPLELHPAPRFISMLPQPLELAAVVRRVARYSFGAYDDRLLIMNSRNGSVFTRRCKGRELTHGLHRPLCPEGGMPIVPPFPTSQYPFSKILDAVLSKEEGGDLSYLYLLVEWATGAINFKISVYVLQDGAWCMRAMATDQIQDREWCMRAMFTHQFLLSLQPPRAVLVGDRIYIASTLSDDTILVFDFTASSLSRIPLPQEVKYQSCSTALSRAYDASGVYLTHFHVNELQLRIWLHKGDNWLLVHTICLHEMCAKLRMLDHTLEDEHTDSPSLCHVGDNAEFVFLKMYGCTLYLDVSSRRLHKVHQRAEKDRALSAIYPLMMIWPPIFPALKDDPARNAM